MNYLLELLGPKNIIYDLKSSSKEEILKILVTHAVKNHILSESSSEEILNALLNREKSMSTGIGSGVAIPHCSVSSVDSLKCVIGISKSGLDFEAIDNLPVHIFVMLIVPREQFQEHIKTLALIAKTLNSEEKRKQIIDAHSFEEIYSALKI
ncbi:MAG: PTS sugar transporter subunit IIA [Leptospiraceae bacterium]|nr:PTS sugar transporter subunit IIA [Leptospiraceae bacterium]MCK6380976.1 PTS sugar transporter subunit IIA [Leptospiraceae bacterium]NUM41001.1 PTS sugar transporter subunit IIA [Leptospiraceae bacterium]